MIGWLKRNFDFIMCVVVLMLYTFWIFGCGSDGTPTQEFKRIVQEDIERRKGDQ